MIYTNKIEKLYEPLTREYFLNYKLNDEKQFQKYIRKYFMIEILIMLFSLYFLILKYLMIFIIMILILIYIHSMVFSSLNKLKLQLQWNLRESFPDFAISFLTLYCETMNNPIVALGEATKTVPNTLLQSEIHSIINTYNNFNKFDDFDTNMKRLRVELNKFADLINTREAQEFVSALQMFFTNGFDKHKQNQMIETLKISQNSIIEAKISRKIAVLDTKIIFPIGIIPLTLLCTTIYFIFMSMSAIKGGI